MFSLQNRTRVQVWLYENINTRIEGHIVGFDEYMNLVLDDAAEVIIFLTLFKPAQTSIALWTLNINDKGHCNMFFLSQIECPETDWRSALYESLKIRPSYWSKFKFRLTFYVLTWREKYTFKQGTFHAIWTPWLSLFFLCYGRARSDDKKYVPSNAICTQSRR